MGYQMDCFNCCWWVMRWFNLSEALWLITSYRLVNIRGRYGSGKTLLSVALAYELYRQKYVDYIFAPMPLIGSYMGTDKQDRFAMVLDEAHVILDSREFHKNETKTWLRDLRRREGVLFTPAVIDVDKRTRPVIIQRMLQVGNLFWLYRMRIEDGMAGYECNLGLFKPSDYFGAYPRKYSPTEEDFERLKVIMRGDREREERNEADLRVFAVHQDENIQFEKSLSPNDIKTPFGW